TLKLNWQRELWNHARLKSEVLNGTKPYHADGDIWIINYDVLQAWVPWLQQQNVQVVIFDEFQKIMNRSAKRTKASVKLGSTPPHIIGLSGTPLRNRPIEFFPMLNMIAPHEFPSYMAYGFRYCDP